jgi:hypothetical protein
VFFDAIKDSTRNIFYKNDHFSKFQKSTILYGSYSLDQILNYLLI